MCCWWWWTMHSLYTILRVHALHLVSGTHLYIWYTFGRKVTFQIWSNDDFVPLISMSDASCVRVLPPQTSTPPLSICRVDVIGKFIQGLKSLGNFTRWYLDSTYPYSLGCFSCVYVVFNSIHSCPLPLLVYIYSHFLQHFLRNMANAVVCSADGEEWIYPIWSQETSPWWCPVDYWCTSFFWAQTLNLHPLEYPFPVGTVWRLVGMHVVFFMQ